MYIPLKITTEYSLLKSLIKIDNLITYLKDNNITSCAICDTNLYGVMEFYNKMKSNNLKPIIGLNINIDGYDIYLYAKNYNGYLNLLKIHTLKELEELNFNTLNNYLSNLKIILPSNSYTLMDRFEQAYLGYSNNSEKIEALLKEKPVVYIKDISCLTKEDTIYLNYLEAINKSTTINNINTDNISNYLNLNVLEEDLLSTINFIEDINIEINHKESYIPVYNKDIDSDTHLYNLAHKGLNKRLNNNVPKEYINRLNYELDVIKKMGFTDYFLIVYDYVLYAKKNNILVGPGRGSAAGSLVSYSIGITNVDPIKYDLLFERFLNPERITMPDIDIDFEYTKRSEVIDYVREKYGKYNVAPIMTFGTLGSKQVIRDVGRALNISLDIIDKFASLIDAKKNLSENLANKEVKESLLENNELKKLYQISLKLEGLKRHISTHAAGVVISSKVLDEIIPLTINDSTVTTGITMEYLEDIGLLKMDFLALKNLTIIKNVLDLIKENTGKHLDLNRINLNDQNIYKLFSEADTEGIFQYESSGMKNLMLKLKPSSFSDLVASVALFRPGPMKNIDSFIARKYNLEPINYLHPDLEPILKETYGIIVYQEQVMQVLVKIGGYTYAEADNIRRAMSKKKESVIISDKEHFISNATNKGYSKDVSLKIYDLILKFANYGFNKAHSVSYALIGYQMAYLKAKFPIYFIANLLNMSIGSEIKTKEYIDEAKKKGITILKPDINISNNCYVISNNSLILPLNSIKNLGESGVNAILEERKINGEFKSYLEFITRTYSKSINKKTYTSLIESGVLDSLGLSKKTMLDNLDSAINYATLVSELDQSFCLPPSIEEKEEFSSEELRNLELKSYGFYISNHPSSKYLDKSIVKLENISNYFDKHIKCVVLIEKIRTIKTKKGDNMAFVSASDETGLTDFIVFPKIYHLLSNIKNQDLIAVQGRVTKRFDNYQINIEYLTKI